MKTIAVSLLLGAGALCMTVPASAEGLLAKETMLKSTASAQVDMSSRHRHNRVKRVVMYPRAYRSSYAFAPVGIGFSSGPYVSSYRSYEPYAWGPPGPYVGVGFGGYDSYAYAPGPYIGIGGYGPSYIGPYYGGPGLSVGFGFGGPDFW
jgi:hypothetical protein